MASSYIIIMYFHFSLKLIKREDVRVAGEVLMDVLLLLLMITVTSVDILEVM